MLHDGHGDAHDVGLLERVRADDAARHLACDDDERHRVHVGRRDARDRVRGPRAAGDDGHAHVARGARVAVRLVHGALFVTRQHVSDLGGIVQCVVDLDGLAAWIAEHEVDAFGLERGHDGLGAGHAPSLLRRLAAKAARRALGGRRRSWLRHALSSLGGRLAVAAAGGRAASGLACVRHATYAPLSCRRDEPRVLREHAVVMLRRRRLPGRAAAFQLGAVHVQRERAILDVDRHQVAFLHERDGAACRSLGAHVPHGRALRRAREAAVGDERHAG